MLKVNWPVWLSLSIVVISLFLIGLLGRPQHNPQEAPEVKTQQPIGSAKGQTYSQQQKKGANDSAPFPDKNAPCNPEAEGDCYPQKIADEVGEYWPFFILGSHLKITDSLLALFTFVLIIVGAIQSCFLYRTDRGTRLAADGANISANVARQTLHDTQRAFVFLDTFETDMINNDFVIVPRWRNSGTTPTRFMTNWVNWKIFPDGTILNNFTFPDLEVTGNPIPNSEDEAPITFAGPNTTARAQQLVIGAAYLDAVRTGQGRILVWGWTRYKDVFGVRHITRFCNEIKITQLRDPVAETAPPQVHAAISFPVYGCYNCTDDECQHQGIPRDWKPGNPLR